MPPHSQSLLMGGIRFEGFLQHLGLVPHALLLRRYLRLGRNSGGIFASPTNHLLPRFLSPSGGRGPDALRTPWDRWRFIYLVPSPKTRFML